MAKHYGRNYALGTRVQHRNGYIFVKATDEEGNPKLIAEGRRVWELTRGPLEEGDRVFHLNGDRTNNKIGNLAKVHFSSIKFVFLKESRVLWSPKRGPALLPTIRTLDKKTGKVLVNS